MLYPPLRFYGCKETMFIGGYREKKRKKKKKKNVGHKYNDAKPMNN